MGALFTRYIRHHLCDQLLYRRVHVLGAPEQPNGLHQVSQLVPLLINTLMPCLGRTRSFCDWYAQALLHMNEDHNRIIGRRWF
jgi:hypothetical protein